MKSSVSRQIGRFGNEASRRLYRGAADAAKKLEQHLDLSINLNELFSSETTDLRMRLKDYCERLIFTDPVEYGKKAEDLLWRKVFYDFFNRCKQNRKKLLESEYFRSALISHLLAGIGFYHHMLLRIQTEFHIDLEGKVDVPFLWHLKGVKKERWKKYQQSAASDGNIRAWASGASHRILIYLGDLERYIAELNEPESNHLAERYYQQSFCINCQNGTPHNQLGSLYNNRFDSAYHYMRCLACHDKFDGAEGNLIRVFEKNDEIVKQLSFSKSDNNESPDCSRFLSRFLKLCHMFYISTGENSEIYCQDILREFDIMLNCYPDKASENCSVPLSDDTVFKVVVMSLMCVAKCQENGNADASVATAFCLALFSYIVHRTTKRLLSSIYECKPELKTKNSANENLSPKQDIALNKELLSDTSGESDINKDFRVKKLGSKKITLKKISARRLHTLRRRRKMSSTSQEDSELSDGEITELPESDEESALLNSDVSQTGSCSSESLSENEDELLEDQNNVNNEGKLKKEINLDKNYIQTNGVAREEDNFRTKEACILNETASFPISQADSVLDDAALLPAEKLILVLKKNGLLKCLKILSDWLRINEDILSACAESSQFLLSRLIELLNFLLKIEEKLLYSKEHLCKLQQNGPSWKQVYPLPEDISLQGLSLIKEIHSRLSFDIAKKRELSPSSQVFLRIQCLLSFGRCLAKASESSVDFDAEKNKYYFNLCNKKESNKDVANNQESISHDIETQRQHLMRSMAHLWLKAEVNDLETLVEGGSTPQLSPYLVCDTSLLCYNLSSLRQLILSKRFIVVVPLVVIASLDQLKKESIQAREAIRWLESELRKGCRYIRAQRQMEKISLVPMKYPKKKEKEAWDFFQILECCNYLVQQQTNGKTDCPLVTLLVGAQNQLPENALPIAQSIDVTIENLKGFLLKWRSYSKNPG